MNIIFTVCVTLFVNSQPNVVNAVAIWPVTGQGVENTKWPAVLYSQKISRNRKIPAKLNYHVDLGKSSDLEMLYRSQV